MRGDEKADKAQTALVEFRHAYTQLCMSMVHALNAGKDPIRVRRANSTGAALIHDRYLLRVRAARFAVNRRIDEAKAANVTAEALVQTAREARATIETEWDKVLPLRSFS